MATSSREHMTSQVWLWLFIVIAVTVGNNVTYKVLFSKFHQRYAFFANQASNVIYIVLSLCWTSIRIHQGIVTKEMSNFPKRVFVVMAFLDGFSNFLSALGATHTPGQFQTILNQLAIPVSILASYLWLRRRYSVLQVIGALVIIIGALLAIVPEFAGQAVHGARWYAVLIFALGNIPMNINTVYKESAFKGKTEIDVVFLTTWVSALQFAIGFLFMPILMLPGFGGIPASEIPFQLSGGFQCMLGVNSRAGDDCVGAWKYLVAFSLVNFAFNVASLWLFKVGSAVVASMSTAIALPITNCVFVLPFIMGLHTEAITSWDIIGLAVVISGFLLYSLSPRGRGVSLDDMTEPLLQTQP